MAGKSAEPQVRTIGRYALHREVAAGGMATVHLGRLLGPVGFSRTVAIKRLHAQYAKDPEFVSMFLDEARLAARIRHPNVVSTLDVVAQGGEIFLVMDFVQGESLARLMRASWDNSQRMPPAVTVGIMSSVLAGLHAAHSAVSEQREPLGIIHRDVSPHNVLVGVDGVARVVDFGVAKAAGRLQTTREGQLKGKLAYMPPEQVRGEPLDRRVDVYAASVILWEALAGRRLFDGDEANVVFQILEPSIVAPSTHAPDVPAALDAIVLRGLSVDPADRFSSTLEMADALEAALAPATARQIANWLASIAADALEERASMVAEVEKSTPTGDVSAHLPPGSVRKPSKDAAPMSRIPESRVGLRRSVVPLLAASGAIGAIGAAIVFMRPSPPVAAGEPPGLRQEQGETSGRLEGPKADAPKATADAASAAAPTPAATVAPADPAPSAQSSAEPKSRTAKPGAGRPGSPPAVPPPSPSPPAGSPPAPSPPAEKNYGF